MILTIEAQTARELRAKIKELADILGVEPSQIPTPVAASAAETLKAEGDLKEVPAGTVAAAQEEREEKQKRTRRTKAQIEAEEKAKASDGLHPALKNEAVSMNDEPAAVINWEDKPAAELKEEAAAVRGEAQNQITKKEMTDVIGELAGLKDIEYARGFLMKFTAENGEPSRSLGTLKESDYAACHALISKELADIKAKQELTA